MSVKRVFLILSAGAIGGALLAFFAQGVEWVPAGIGLGALVGLLLAVMDNLVAFGLALAAKVSRRPLWLALSGGTIGALLGLILSAAILSAIGWIGSCWG
jgi:hypothetical protein